MWKASSSHVWGLHLPAINSVHFPFSQSFLIFPSFLSSPLGEGKRPNCPLGKGSEDTFSLLCRVRVQTSCAVSTHTLEWQCTFARHQGQTLSLPVWSSLAPLWGDTRVLLGFVRAQVCTVQLAFAGKWVTVFLYCPAGVKLLLFKRPSLWGGHSLRPLAAVEKPPWRLSGSHLPLCLSSLGYVRHKLSPESPSHVTPQVWPSVSPCCSESSYIYMR